MKWLCQYRSIGHQGKYALILAVTAMTMCSATQNARSQDLSNSEEIKPFTIDGSISVSGSKYSVSGAPRRRPPTSWTLIGSPTVSFYGVSLPFTFILSDQESDFRQPFDQVGVSPQYKWATLHLGYRSLTYSKYTLAGISFLGAGLDLNPDPLRFSVMYGRFQRAVEEDTTNISVQPAYKRMGFAAKIGYGDDKAFFDVIYLHALDDSNSLKRHPTTIDLFPEENTILGLNTKIKIIPQLTFDGEVAASILTRDIRAQKIDSTQIPKSLQWLIDTRASTNVLIASTTGLSFRVPHFNVRVGYERVEPDYASLGAYYYTTDIENYTIAPGFDAFENKLRASGSVGVQYDNVLGTKLARTQRLIGSGNISVNPSQVFGIDLNYSNYSTQQGGSKSNLINDSTRISSVSQSASITPRLLFISAATTQSIVVSASYQDYTDQNIFTNKYANSQTTSGTINYNISFLKEGASLGASVLIADTKQTSTSTSLRGITVNGSKSFIENKLSVGASLGFTQTAISLTNSKTSTFTESINSSYRLSSQATLAFSMYATENSTAPPLIAPFIEILATLTYTQNFSF